MTDSDRERRQFAKKCYARRAAGLVLSGSWTIAIAAELKQVGGIYDPMKREWLMPNMQTMNDFLARQPELAELDTLPLIRGCCTYWQKCRGLPVLPPWPSDIRCMAQILTDYPEEQARKIIAHLALVTADAWPDCQSLSAAWRAFAALVVSQVDRVGDEQRKRQEAQAQDQANKLQTEADRLQRQAAELRWNSLPAEKRSEIEAEVRREMPRIAARSTTAVLLRCLVAAGLLPAPKS
jgi:hypothetical protein